jgi:hypothetical protein
MADVEFKPPDGVVPEDIHAGDTFDLVTTYELRDSGEVCVVQMGDVKMPGYDEGEYKRKTKGKTRQSYGNMMDSMHAAMNGGGSGEGEGY